MAAGVASGRRGPTTLGCLAAQVEFAQATEDNDWDDELEDFTSEEEDDPLKALLDELPS